MQVMNVLSCAGLLALGSLLPTVAQAQGSAPCTARFLSGFSRITPLSQRRDPAEVSAIFGPRQDLCEAGAYQRFLESYLDLAREAMRASAKQRDAQVRVAIALIGQLPARVPAEEAKAAGALFRQTRSDLYAIADDVRMPPVVRQLLDSFDRAGPPVPESTAQVPPLVTIPPPAQGGQPGQNVQGGQPPAQGGQPGQNVQTVRVPSTALPSWAVVSLYEARELLKQRDPTGAQAKLESVLRWMETAP